jgi:hypothetical protein
VVANSTLQYLQLVSVRVLDIEVSRAVAIFLYRAKRNAPRRENLRSILEVLAVEEIIAFQALTVVFSLREAHEVDSGMFLVILELANDCVLDIVPIAYIDVSSRANLEPKFLTVPNAGDFNIGHDSVDVAVEPKERRLKPVSEGHLKRFHGLA